MKFEVVTELDCLNVSHVAQIAKTRHAYLCDVRGEGDPLRDIDTCTVDELSHSTVDATFEVDGVYTQAQAEDIVEEILELAGQEVPTYREAYPMFDDDAE